MSRPCSQKPDLSCQTVTHSHISGLKPVHELPALGLIENPGPLRKSPARL